MIAKICAYFKAREGATAIEYGLIAAGVSVAIALVVFTLGDQLEALFQRIATALQGAGNQS